MLIMSEENKTTERVCESFECDKTFKRSTITIIYHSPDPSEQAEFKFCSEKCMVEWVVDMWLHKHGED